MNKASISTLASALALALLSVSEEDRAAAIAAATDSDSDSISPAAVLAQQSNLPLPTANAGSNVELDADQVPWDERIHASTRNKNADGRWKRKRNVDDATYNSIAASLKSTAAAPAAVAPSLPSVAAAAPSLPPPPVAAAPSLPPAPAQAPEYTDLVALLVSNTNGPDNPTGRLTAEWIEAALKGYGVVSGKLPDAAVNPALCATIAAGVRQALGIAA
jgi:hypothetical protein